MPAVFATHTDLEGRWRPLKTGEQSRADVLLGTAARIIRRNFPDIDQRVAAGELDAIIPIDVSCAMVRRAFQESEAGSFQIATVKVERRAVAPTEDDVYLTQHDRAMLSAAPAAPSGVVPKGNFPAPVTWPPRAARWPCG